MPAELLDLFWQFMLFSLLAFGGGGTVLGLVDRVAVADKGWITPAEFSAAVGFTFITPGPILVLAPFVGYLVAGAAGAVVATLGVFLAPWALAMGSAHRLRSYLQHPRLRAFGKGAGPAIVGLFSLAVLTIARSSLSNVALVAVALIAGTLMARTKLHPIVILAGGALAGLVLGIPALEGALPEIRIP